jgi:hypothetical protein
MTIQGIIVLILIGLVLVLWILDLVRRDHLYVGYGVVLIISILGVMLVLSVPPLLAFITRMVGAVFPASALTLLALCFIVFMLIYVLTQVTIVSNRLATVVQELAILRARESAQNASQGDGVAGESGREPSFRDSEVRDPGR